MPPLETDQTLSQYCYNALKDKIIRGELPPGEKLRMAKLTALLKVGPSPIREALSSLVSSGLIQAEPNRGFFVSAVCEADIRDLYATFNRIELLALNLSIDLGTAAWEARILGALHELSVVEKARKPFDHLQWLQLNNAFHFSLISACQSPCLLKIRENLYQLFDRYCHLSLIGNEESLLSNNQEHREIAKAVLNRDKTLAGQLITAHLENSLITVLKKLIG